MLLRASAGLTAGALPGEFRSAHWSRMKMTEQMLGALIVGASHSEVPRRIHVIAKTKGVLRHAFCYRGFVVP